MRHSMKKDTAFNGETTPRHTCLCSDSQCLPPGDPRILCAKHGSPGLTRDIDIDIPYSGKSQVANLIKCLEKKAKQKLLAEFEGKCKVM